MGSQRIITNSITLKPGEQFTLPPGARIIATNNSAALSSTCDIPQLENFSCYVAMVVAAGEEGNTTQYFESGAVSIVGYRINGSDYLFSKPYPANDDGLYEIFPLANELKQLMGGMILSTAAAADSNNERGSLTYLVISTVPSIGDNMYLILSTSIPHDDYNQDATFLAPFRKYSDVSGKGYKSLPPCTTSINT